MVDPVRDMGTGHHLPVLYACMAGVGNDVIYHAPRAAANIATPSAMAGQSTHVVDTVVSAILPMALANARADSLDSTVASSVPVGQGHHAWGTGHAMRGHTFAVIRLLQGLENARATVVTQESTANAKGSQAMGTIRPALGMVHAMKAKMAMGHVTAATVSVIKTQQCAIMATH
eukprot:gene57953-biopygen116572